MKITCGVIIMFLALKSNWKRQAYRGIRFKLRLFPALSKPSPRSNPNLLPQIPSGNCWKSCQAVGFMGLGIWSGRWVLFQASGWEYREGGCLEKRLLQTSWWHRLFPGHWCNRMSGEMGMCCWTDQFVYSPLFSEHGTMERSSWLREMAMHFICIYCNSSVSFLSFSVM